MQTRTPHGAGPSIALLAQLRERTGSHHERLERAIGPVATLEDYGRYLQGMDAFLAAATRHCGDDTRITSRRALLRMDLLDWGFVPGRHEHAGPACDVGNDAGYRLGWQYVVAGSTLGARGLLRDVTTRAYGALLLHRFLHAHARSGDWGRFTTALRNAGAERSDRICTGALDAFDAAHTAFRGGG